MDIEAERDLTMLLKAYLRAYLFHSGNKMPDKIVCPAIKEVPHPHDASKMIPVEWVMVDSHVAVELAIDVSEVPAAEIDVAMPPEVSADATSLPTPEAVSTPQTASLAKKAFADVHGGSPLNTDNTDTPPGRVPNQPAHVVPPGQPLDDMHPRGRKDLAQTKKDLAPEAEVDEDAEREYDIKKEQ